MKKVIIGGIEYIPKEIETWTDPETGLIWERQGSEKTMSWKKALKYAETLGDNWRLPTIQELVTLADFTKINPACKITNTHSSGYWSSTTFAGDTYDAWCMFFGYGGVGSGYKSNRYYVRCVKENKK
ncbi:MAG: Lcl C-terminal domain-containing protein [Candidatus Ranarchaeia archaeon]